MTLAFLVWLIALRLLELVIARRNTARLLAAGAREAGAKHYPWMIALHASWLAAMVVDGWDEAVRPGWLAAFAVLQVLRLWILGTLGPRWTTRIIVTGTPLVASGPFRWLRHPNYTLVVAEIVTAPLVLGLGWIAAVWTVLNFLMLQTRIAAEDAAIRPG